MTDKMPESANKDHVVSSLREWADNLKINADKLESAETMTPELEELRVYSIGILTGLAKESIYWGYLKGRQDMAKPENLDKTEA